MKKLVIALLAVLVFVSCCSAAAAAEEVRKMEIRVAWGEMVDPFSHPMSTWFTPFKYYVESLSDGKMTVVLHPAGSLGTAPQTLDSLIRGVIHIGASLPTGVIASKYCPALNAMNIPFLFRNAEVAATVLNDPEIMGDINTVLDSEAGIRIISLMGMSSAYMTNSVRPIKTVADLKGLKMRVMEGKIYSEIYKSLGASAIPIPWAELYTALQTKIVDGQENPPINIVYKALQECQKYVTIPGPITGYGIYFVNSKWYDSLNGSEKAIVDKANEYGRKAFIGVNEILGIQANRTLAEKLDIHQLTDEEYAEFKSVSQSGVMSTIIEETKGNQAFVDKLLQKTAEVEANWKDY